MGSGTKLLGTETVMRTVEQAPVPAPTPTLPLTTPLSAFVASPDAATAKLVTPTVTVSVELPKPSTEQAREKTVLAKHPASGPHHRRQPPTMHEDDALLIALYGKSPIGAKNPEANGSSELTHALDEALSDLSVQQAKGKRADKATLHRVTTRAVYLLSRVVETAAVGRDPRSGAAERQYLLAWRTRKAAMWSWNLSGPDQTLRGLVKRRGAEQMRARIKSLAALEKKRLEGVTRFDVALSKLPKDAVHKLFIDHKRHAEGALGFDIDEPGYLASLVNAFGWMRETMGIRFDADLLTALHDRAVSATLNEKGERFERGTNTRSIHMYGFDKSQASPEAMKEWASEHLIYDCDGDASYHAKHKKEDFLAVYAPARLSQETQDAICSRVAGDEGTARTYMEAMFTRYDQDLGHAKTALDKKRAVVRLVRSLEIGHFFPDGNQRTLVFLFLNKLLIENELPPVIVPDPFAFDGYKSINELVAEIEVGAELFRKATLERDSD